MADPVEVVRGILPPGCHAYAESIVAALSGGSGEVPAYVAKMREQTENVRRLNERIHGSGEVPAGPLQLTREEMEALLPERRGNVSAVSSAHNKFRAALRSGEPPEGSGGKGG